MVEVFKTNVQNHEQANMLINRIHQSIKDYRANFDLSDCDNILRVECATGLITPSLILNLFRHLGFHAEVLPDNEESIAHIENGKFTDQLS